MVKAKHTSIIWDTQRLARFGRAVLIQGSPVALLVQAVGPDATYMKMEKKGGLFVLDHVRQFGMPTELVQLGTWAFNLSIMECIRVSRILLDIELPTGGLGNVLIPSDCLHSLTS